MAGIFDLLKKIGAGNEKARGPIDAIVAGLGNPGKDYAGTRHNAGYLALDYLCGREGFAMDRLRFCALTADRSFGGHRVLFLKPQTFMNRSGESVGEACRFYKIPPERVFVLCDDISLPPGKIRIRRKGSDGGHNGLKSIVSHLGSDNFPRIKIGVGDKPHPDYALADWVLGELGKEDREPLLRALEQCRAALPMILGGDFEGAMAKYN